MRNHTCNCSLYSGAILQLDSNCLVVQLHQKPKDVIAPGLRQICSIPHQLHLGKILRTALFKMNDQLLTRLHDNYERENMRRVLTSTYSSGLASVIDCVQKLESASILCPAQPELGDCWSSWKPGTCNKADIRVPSHRFERESPPKVNQSTAHTGYEVSVGINNTNQATRRLERRLIELRLSRAIRRFQDRVRHRIQRRCELRQFVVLRMQFICRNRSRTRAAVAIQRFFRTKLSCKASGYTIPPSPNTV